MPSPIRELPKQLIDQIKAGEVIERPGFLIKELLENSVDAQASEISIHIQGNGLKLIHIHDNGLGMTKEDLALAFKRHSTSKIRNFDDLYRLNSFGFRGEALASIASVSKLTCLSKQQNNPAGKIEFKAETQEYLIDTDKKDQGTEIYVKDLFYNTPVRLKFVSSEQAEKNFIKRILMSFMISNPEISFRLRNDQDPEVKILNATQDCSHRIKETFKVFERMNTDFKLIDRSYDGVRLKLYLSERNNFKSMSATKNFIFINSRMVNHPQIHSLINQVLGHDVEGFPRYVLELEVPPNQIDVNVHPNKTHIKFFDPSKILALVKGSLPKPISTQSSGDISSSSAFGLNLPQGEHDLSLSKNSLYWEIKDSPFFLFNFHGETFMAHKVSLLLGILLKKLEHNEITPVPLLISEPIVIEQELSSLTIFEKIGFELDILDDKTYALRSYPKCLADFPYLSLIKALLAHNGDFSTIENLILTSIKDPPALDISIYGLQAEEVTQNFEYFKLNGILKPVSSKIWEKIYQS